MPMGIHNPLPSSMASECKKCGKILASFVDPRQTLGRDMIIPPDILAGAKGLAIMTVIKAGFLGSARYGNGVVVARLSDGTWSAPSAIGTAGIGFGGQIGAELTDFVFILNDAVAVRTFSQAGSIQLGGNVSIAAGPIGRNGEVAGAASRGGVAAVFSYSKTKGLFAGVSLEGSAIVERRDANEKLYGQRFTAKQLLEGSVRPPAAAAPLMAVLNSKIFAGVQAPGDTIYNDIPVYDDRTDTFEPRRGSQSASSGNADDYVYSDRPKRASTWADDVYDRPAVGTNSRTNTGFGDDYLYSDQQPKKTGPGRPAAPKPLFANKTGGLQSNEAIALFTFDADQPGDLGFKKGDIITVTKKTDSDNDWWTGIIGTQTGIFPSNYVKMRD